jgi:diguanylate cyclase (GGDEF)-like protein
MAFDASSNPMSRPRWPLSPLALSCLLWLPQNHPHGADRARQIQLRLKPLALVLAALVLTWIPLDWVALPTSELAQILMLRLLLAALLVGLALLPPLHGSTGAMLRLLALMLLQVAFYGWMAGLVGRSDSALLQLGYQLYPFLVVAQIAIFPLAAGEAALLALPALVAVLLPILGGEAGDPGTLGGLWLLLALGGLAVAAAASQMALLASLLGARQQAGEDPLTGLANRRALDQRLSAEIARARRERRPLSAIVLDIDHFKRVNDSLGHAAGDEVLVHLAHILRAELRGADLAARSGGEEFCLLLPGIAAEDAWWVAERIRQRVADNPTVLESGEAVPVTVSLGIAALGEDDDRDSLLARADQAMYRAKQSGRNRSASA